MIKKLTTLYILIFSLFGFSQNESIINKDNIEQLTRIVDSINSSFLKLKEYPTYKSLEQTTASYFKIKTLKGEELVNKLDANYPFDKLSENNDFLEIDTDLLVTKSNSSYPRNKESFITIQSYEINQNGKHSIRVKYGSLNQNKKQQYFYKTYYSSKNKTTTFYGFYIHKPFKAYELPDYINKQIVYADAIIGKEQVFAKRDYNDFLKTGTFKTVQFNKFYDSITKKPVYDKSIRYFDFIQKINRWKKTKDSLFHEDYLKNENTRIETNSIITNIIEEGVSDDDLHNFVIKYGSKEKGLFLKRNYPDITPNCFGNSTISNLRDIAYLASDIPNWSVYIQAHLGFLNWNFFQNWSNNNLKIRKDKSTKELTKLPLHLNDLLFGVCYKISNPATNHYKGYNNHLTKTYAYSKNKLTTIEFYEKILKDSRVDPFNKLKIYHMLNKSVSNTVNSNEKKSLQLKLNNCIENLPTCIKDRIGNNNLEFENLLGKQKELFLEHFIIPSTSISAYSSSGTWNGKFKLKGEKQPIEFYLYEDTDKNVTDVQNLIVMKDEYLKRVKNNSLLKDYLEKKSNKLTIKLVNGKSYHKNNYDTDIPVAIINKYKSDFDDAISLNISFKDNVAKAILFPNGDLLLTRIPKDFQFNGYVTKELLTKENSKESLFGMKNLSYYSFKIFNKKGNLIN